MTCFWKRKSADPRDVARIVDLYQRKKKGQGKVLLINDVVTLTKPLASDPPYMVKEQLLRTLGAVGVANNETIDMIVSFAKPSQVSGKIIISPLEMDMRKTSRAS